MTGGTVLILGAVGRNFGAGMTGGVAYVWDPHADFVDRKLFHPESVEVTALTNCAVSEQTSVHELLRQHVVMTESSLGKSFLDGWQHTLQNLLRVSAKGEP